MSSRQPNPGRVLVGFDGYSEARDAVVLGAAIARASGAELLLATVHPDPMVVLPADIGWKGMKRHAESTLRQARDSLAPGARIVAETDFSIPRALTRVARREHQDLLVVGSSRHAPDGHVRIGKRTRQLLGTFERALAVAPRGLHRRAGDVRILRIGVGFDGGPESRAGLALAQAIAANSDAELRIRAVVDDRVRALGWPGVEAAPTLEPAPGASAAGDERAGSEWDALVHAAVEALHEQLHAVAEGGASARTEVHRGRPADALLALCDEVDLLVVGSRRWGPVARVALGSTGEALMHDATCPVLIVPRPLR
jgi:nucleotide-binding universal stress UspA family protein